MGFDRRTRAREKGEEVADVVRAGPESLEVRRVDYAAEGREVGGEGEGPEGFGEGGGAGEEGREVEGLGEVGCVFEGDGEVFGGGDAGGEGEEGVVHAVREGMGGEEGVRDLVTWVEVFAAV